MRQCKIQDVPPFKAHEVPQRISSSNKHSNSQLQKMFHSKFIHWFPSNRPGWGKKPPPTTKKQVDSWKINSEGFQTYFTPEVLGRTLHASIQVRDMNECFDASFPSYPRNTSRNIYKFIFKTEVSKTRQKPNIRLRAINSCCLSTK